MANEKNGKQRELNNVVILLLVIGAVLAFCILSSLYIHRNKFVYEESLDETVLAVDGRQVTLREFGYYIYKVEQFVNEQAIVYDASHPLEYWNKHFRVGRIGAFVSVLARDEAYSLCICDMIYEDMALGQGYSLSKEERDEAAAEADKMYRAMSDRQLSKTGLTREIIEQIKCRKKLIAKFAKDYVRTIDFTGYEGYREELISAGGEYYEKQILPKHKVKCNENIKKGLKFGRITVNSQKDDNN